MGNVLAFRSKEERQPLRELLEPGEKGLVIATTDHNFDYSKHFRKHPGQPPEQGKVFLWMVGKPRKVISNSEGLWGLVNHSDGLLSTTYGSFFQQDLPRGSYIKNLETGNVAVPSSFTQFCSDGTQIYGVIDKYTSDIWIQSPFQHIPARHDPSIGRIQSDGTLEVIAEREKAETAALICGPEGLIVSEQPTPRGHGDLRIVRVSDGETLWHAKQECEWGKCNAPKSLVYAGNQLLFPHYPRGIKDSTDTVVAQFDFAPWLFRKLEEHRDSQLSHNIYGAKRNFPNHPLLPIWEENFFDQLMQIESVATRNIGYDYRHASSKPEMGFKFDTRWDEESRHWSALRQYLENRFYIHHMAYYDGMLFLGAKHDLYAIPYTPYTTATINPVTDKLWTFKDQISGLAVVEGEQLQHLKGNANMKMGRRRMANVVAFKRAA